VRLNVLKDIRTILIEIPPSLKQKKYPSIRGRVLSSNTTFPPLPLYSSQIHHAALPYRHFTVLSKENHQRYTESYKVFGV
jgi:hypothetical protein